MASLPTTISLIFDVVPTSLAPYMQLTSADRQRLQAALFQKLFGANAAQAKLVTQQPAWIPVLETEVDPVSGLDTGRLPHDTVRAAMDVAVAKLTPLLQGGYAFKRSAGGGHTEDGDEHDGDEHDGGDPATAERPHCVRWILVDGRWVAEYNYGLDLQEPDPADPTTPRSSSMILLTDYLGMTNQAYGRMHIALRYAAD